jgi:transposase
VKKILRGHRREETSRFIAFRSHWRYQSEFCNPARGNEKGGVEGEGGYFRRNHWVPVPGTRSLDELNGYLERCSNEDR